MADIEALLSKETAGLPNWAWVAVVGAGIAAATILPKFFGGKSNDPTTPDTTPSGSSGIGLAIDPTTGLPYAVSGLVPSGGTTGINTTSSSQNTQSLLGTIRGRNTSLSYDKQHTEGIHLESGPNGNSTIGYIPYGTQVSITGAPVSGGKINNLPTSLWYPVKTSTGKTGYVLSTDFVSLPSSVTWPYA
jgi:hypothetical protein